MSHKIRIGALISGGGTNLQAIIDACSEGRIDAEVVCVGTDNCDAGGLARAQRHHIPTFVVDYREIFRRKRNPADELTPPPDFDLEEIWLKQDIVDRNADARQVESFLVTRAVAEARLLACIAPYKIDLLVLAGFMRNLTPYFIDRFNSEPGYPRIMNIHPALLPAFPGVDGYGDTFRYGCKVGGCTVHFIDYGEDSGPIIGQRSFPILDEDTLESVRRKGLEVEWQLYPECIQLFAEGRLHVVKMTYSLGDNRIAQRSVVRIAQVK
jgi:phosphoribosylglycinamide formyltransferase-1